MDISSLQSRAVEIADLYDRYNIAAGRTAWETGDFALGI